MASVLDELDKILENLAFNSFRRSNAERIKLSLPDVNPIDIKRLDLIRRTPLAFGFNLTPNPLFVGDRSSKAIRFRHQPPTTDELFVKLMNILVRGRLATTPTRQYASAKLIICDPPSRELLMKYSRLMNRQLGQNFIYRQPNNVTAVFLLEDMVNLFERPQQPVIEFKYDSSRGQQLASYNYDVVRKRFPYLKMSDLFLLLINKGPLELGKFVLNSPKEHQVIQFLNRFAHSTQMIEIIQLFDQIGMPHRSYDNLLCLGQYPSEIGASLVLGARQAQLKEISHFAEKLLSVLDKLELLVSSVTYRALDPSGHTKLLADLVVSGSESKLNQKQGDHHAARLLIIDRFHDLSSLLYHADKYGSFLEQESSDPLMRSDDSSELDELLRQEKLTNVLGAILKYASSVKRSKTELAKFKANSIHTDSAMATSRSIRHHLDEMKTLYQRLNEGYLLLLRLESGLESMNSELRDHSGRGLTPRLVEKLTERMQRAIYALKQLTDIAGKSIRPMDLVRVACILLDVINSFTIHQNLSDSPKMNKELRKMRETILGSEFKTMLKKRLEREEAESSQLKRMLTALENFDQVSREYCNSKSSLTLEEMIRKFVKGELERESYIVNDFRQDLVGTHANVLVFLGTLTPHEISTIKNLEQSLFPKEQMFYLFTGNIDNPDRILLSL